MNVEKEIDFSDQINAMTYPVEEEDQIPSFANQKRFGGTKRADLPDNAFLDRERRSFPIKTCQDVKDAVSSWGRYKGGMSFDEFKRKLKNRASRMGCSIPKSWQDEGKGEHESGKPVSEYKCPEGKEWDKKSKKCMPMKKERSYK